MRQIYLVAHDMRSTHNVGSLLRTAEGMGVTKLFLTGYTPYPQLKDDERLPHIYKKLTEQIQKTSLNAHEYLKWEHREDIFEVIDLLNQDGVEIAALEQTKKSSALNLYQPPEKVAIVLGTEATGLPDNILSAIDLHLEIPMFGEKESFNVVQAAAMTLYHMRFPNIS